MPAFPGQARWISRPTRLVPSRRPVDAATRPGPAARRRPVVVDEPERTVAVKERERVALGGATF